MCSKYILNLLHGLWVLVYQFSLDLGVAVVKGAASATGVNRRVAVFSQPRSENKMGSLMAIPKSKFSTTYLVFLCVSCVKSMLAMLAFTACCPSQIYQTL